MKVYLKTCGFPTAKWYKNYYQIVFWNRNPNWLGGLNQNQPWTILALPIRAVSVKLDQQQMSALDTIGADVD